MFTYASGAVVATVVSATALSPATESVAKESSTMLSTATLSESVPTAFALVLPPQEAKEIAAKATNMKTNFFIGFEIF